MDEVSVLLLVCRMKSAVFLSVFSADDDEESEVLLFDVEDAVMSGVAASGTGDGVVVGEESWTDSASAAESALPVLLEDANKIASKEAQNEANNQEKSQIYQYINSDFLGLLKGMSAEVKKAKVLEIYRYFFRFCIEKMKSFVENPILMLITL